MAGDCQGCSRGYTGTHPTLLGAWLPTLGRVLAFQALAHLRLSSLPRPARATVRLQGTHCWGPCVHVIALP